ncbi:MAG: universal stress protein, partial [Caldilineae bacterium]
MYKKIAIPLDGSPFSERILGYLPGLVTPHQTELVLLHVIELSHYVSLMAPDALHTVDMGHWRQEGEAYLKRVQGELRDQGYQVKARTIEGDVAGAICDAADQEDVDLIAMTTHGRSGFQNLLLGSVADRVVRTARQPVFLVRPQRDAKPRIPLQRLLVPLDGSELAELALPQAIGLAKANRGEIWLLQAIEFPEYWGEEYIGVQNVPGLIST